MIKSCSTFEPMFLTAVKVSSASKGRWSYYVAKRYSAVMRKDGVWTWRVDVNVGPLRRSRKLAEQDATDYRASAGAGDCAPFSVEPGMAVAVRGCSNPTRNLSRVG